jgi:hypothetical protein
MKNQRPNIQKMKNTLYNKIDLNYNFSFKKAAKQQIHIKSRKNTYRLLH